MNFASLASKYAGEHDTLKKEPSSTVFFTRLQCLLRRFRSGDDDWAESALASCDDTMGISGRPTGTCRTGERDPIGWTGDLGEIGGTGDNIGGMGDLDGMGHVTGWTGNHGEMGDGGGLGDIIG